MDVLTASDRVPGELDGFGFWVAADGDLAAIGAPFDDDLGDNAGAVYVFERDAGTGVWSEVIKLTASDGAAGDLLGRAVAIDGERVVAGALGTEAVYVFEPPISDGTISNAVGPRGPAWAEAGKLEAGDPGPMRAFGFSITVSGDRLAVGANLDSEAATEAGAVYVFSLELADASDANRPPGPTWVQVAKLLGSEPQTGARLGGRLALDGTTLAATAPGDASATGATYVFERDLGGPEAWGERVKIPGPNPGAVAGAGVALVGDQLAVGAPFDSAMSTAGGTAQVYHRNAGAPNNWGLIDDLIAVDADSQDRFGTSTAMSADRLAIAAPFSATPAGPDAGAVHVFGLRPNGRWKPVTLLATSDGTNSQTFAQAVALGGEGGDGSLLLAAPGGEGAVYVFDLGRVILTDGFETGDLESWLSAETSR